MVTIKGKPSGTQTEKGFLPVAGKSFLVEEIEMLPGFPGVGRPAPRSLRGVSEHLPGSFRDSAQFSSLRDRFQSCPGRTICEISGQKTFLFSSAVALILHGGFALEVIFPPFRSGV